MLPGCCGQRLDGVTWPLSGVAKFCLAYILCTTVLSAKVTPFLKEPLPNRTSLFKIDFQKGVVAQRENLLRCKGASLPPLQLGDCRGLRGGRGPPCELRLINSNCFAMQ